MAGDRMPYRPSSGTEGECFIAEFCGNCERSGRPGKPDDVGEEIIGCSIAGRTFLYDEDDPSYPTEWVQDDAGAMCTAFVPLGDPIPRPKCPATPDMFNTFSTEAGNG